MVHSHEGPKRTIKRDSRVIRLQLTSNKQSKSNNNEICGRNDC